MSGPAAGWLTSERLEIRPWTPHAIIAALAGPAVLGVALGARVDPAWPNPDFAEVLPQLAELLVELGEHGLGGLILLRQPGPGPVVVGEIGLKDFPTEDGVVELGYGVVPGYRGQGIATEAVRAFAWGLLRGTRLRAVRAEVEPANRASQRVLEKAGFLPVAGAGPHRHFELARTAMAPGPTPSAG